MSNKKKRKNRTQPPHADVQQEKEVVDEKRKKIETIQA